jgi:hypothetical protein
LQRPIPVKRFAKTAEAAAVGARRVVFEEGQIVDADLSTHSMVLMDCTETTIQSEKDDESVGHIPYHNKFRL